MKKLALFLALCLLVSSIGLTAFAEEAAGDPADPAATEEFATEGEEPGEEPGEEEPAGEEPGEEPGEEEPAGEEPGEEPGEEEPAGEEPGEEPGEEEPAGEEPGEEPGEEEPAGEEPAEEPAAEEPAPAAQSATRKLAAGTVLYAEKELINEIGTLSEDALVILKDITDGAASVLYAERVDGAKEKKIAWVFVDDLLDAEGADLAENELKSVSFETVEPEEKEPEEINTPAEEPAAEEPAAEEPAAEEPAAEEPAAEEPAAEEPAAEEPAAEEPAAEEPAAEEELNQGAPEDFVVRADGTVLEYNGSATSVTLPKVVNGITVTVLSEAVFARKTNIQNVTLPADIVVAPGAFRNCTSLLSVNMSNVVPIISAECFEGCTALLTVSWPQNLTTIEHDAFNGCTSLTGVPQQDSITTIGDNAFKGCTKLTYADLSTNLTTIGQGAFSGCTGLREIMIPDSVTQIGNQAFENCTAAARLRLPTNGGFTIINNYCFSGCSGLADVTIPSNVTEIGREAFANCSGVQVFRLPKELTTVGNNAFSGRNASSWIRWDECQPAPPVYIGTDGLGTAGYVLAPINAPAHTYCKSHSNVHFCSTLIRDFVVRCYNEILLRAGKIDEPGMLTWCGQICTGAKGGSAIVKAFIDSDEFKGKKFNDTQVVTILYKAMLDRTPDTEGMNGWMEKLSYGCSYDRIIYGFATQPEFTKLCNTYLMTPGQIALSKYRDKNWKLTAFVSRCYTEALGRKFDVNGLEDWCRALLTNKKNVVEVVTNFFHSKEFIDKKLSNQEYVHRLYRTLFGRDEDAAGMNSWLTAMAKGKTRDAVLDGFIKSAEFSKHLNTFGLKLPATKKKK